MHDLDALFRPRAVALIADDLRPELTDLLARNLVEGGLEGPVLPVLPHRESVRGLLACADVEALPRAPDLAVILGCDGRQGALIEALGRRGARAVLLAGARGGRTEGEEPARLAASARAAGVRLVGPDALGVLAPGHGLNASLIRATPRAGDLACVTQSGTMLSALLDWASGEGVGFSQLIALGAAADVDAADVLDFLGRDGRTRAVLLYLEEIGRARAFMSAARATARVKPVVVLRPRRVLGADGDGAAARTDRVYDAAFRRAGMVRVDGLEALFAAAETLGLGVRARGPRLTILTNGGGFGRLAVDRLIEQGGELAVPDEPTLAALDAIAPRGWRRGNPIDLGGFAAAETYGEAVRVALADTGGGALLVIHGPAAGVEPQAVAEAVLAARGDSARALVTCWLGQGAAAAARERFAAARVPSFETPRAAVDAFAHVVAYERNQTLLQRVPPSIPDGFAPDAATVAARLERLHRARVRPVPNEDVAAVCAAYGLVAEPAARPRAGVRALAVCAFDHPTFGMAIEIGYGGDAASPTSRRVAALPPLDLGLANDALSAITLDDPSAAARDGLALMLVRVAQLLVDQPLVEGLRLDPIVVVEDGVRIGAAELELRADEPANGQRLAIRPYPKELETTFELGARGCFAVRPLRPEDAARLKQLVERTTPEDRRLRFFSPIASLSAAMTARLTQIDYDREMALAALLPDADDDETFAGVVRLAADADNRRGEFAILLRSDLKGQGLGRRLMELILDYAAERGIEEVYGEVLSENRAMLGLCRALGFTRHRSETEPELLEVRWRRRAGPSDR